VNPPFGDSTESPAEDPLATTSDNTSSGAEPELAHGDQPEPVGGGLIVRPSGVELGRLRPRVVLHIHLSHEALWAFTDGKPCIIGGAARLEGVGPITLGQVRRFLADTGCDVKVQPVVDPQDTPPVDGYEIPRRIREAMFLRMPASCFPYAAGAHRMDLDHTKSYEPPDRGGPPGQAGVHNLGPLSRFEQTEPRSRSLTSTQSTSTSRRTRVKTHSRWRVRQPEPGVWIWRSPHRAYYLVTNAGTHYLGDGPFARKVWRAAMQPRRPSVTAA
jgi:hypothetical protein